ncbi:hypothetical protein CLOSTMETH_00922 [[Clostridium] methylpentosum DSM 5476]|uniref:Uncharacterized protein n=1 Tax=[Clostridium] methylpentosum DSM 5476 TaxID=537013 RepID=C0EAQ8_9FIRM|nr:hypothetical protein CLOSTMETH_00922 [[Clostridium] methylpentosum DSM 5476]
MCFLEEVLRRSRWQFFLQSKISLLTRSRKLKRIDVVMKLRQNPDQINKNQKEWVRQGI